MEKISIRQLTLGEGLPAICVPLTGKTAEDVMRQAEQTARSEADIAEWRADLCDEIFADEPACSRTWGGCGKKQYLAQMISEIRKRLGGKALLFTVRTKKEGGEAEIKAETYEAILSAAIEAGVALSSEAAGAAVGNYAGGIDMIDIEFSAGAKTTGRLVDIAKREGIVSIISSHDFEKTPDDHQIETLAKAMDETGADIVKIAVMPQSKNDVKRFCALAEKIKNGLIKRPCILISMGELGKETRFDAERLGSVLTFGALTEEQASAPGQVTVSELKKELKARLP